MHFDAIDRAGRNAQVTAGAFIDDHRMHQFGSTQNGVHRTSLDALGTAYTFGFADKRNLSWRYTTFGVERDDRNAQQLGQLSDGFVAARWAFIDCFAACHAFGIGLAAGMAAPATLCLGQKRINALYQAHAGSRPWLIESVFR
jgi:hypothetical protein